MAEEIFEQVPDENGVTRLDRRWTPEEAHVIEEANRALLVGGRTGRFDAFLNDTEHEARAKRRRTRA